MFERFTDRARRVVVLAQEESRMLNHHHIGTEHLLLGLLHDDDSETARALERAGVSLVAARGQVEQSHGRGKKAASGHIPFTPRAKMVMERSLRTSQRLGSTSIGSPHILRAILDVPESGAHRLLVGFGVDTAAFALVVDNLARSDSEAAADESAGRQALRAGSAGTRSGFLPITTGMSGQGLAATVAQRIDELARRHDRLADGLRRYGRHRDGCGPDSEQGCTCGFDRLLAEIAPPDTWQQDSASS